MKDPVLIAPSLLASNHARLAEGAKRAEASGGDWLHVDIMDGHFVPNLTFGPATLSAVRKETNLFLDVHLMLEEPQRYAEAFLKAGAQMLTIHAEPTYDIAGTLALIRSHGCQCGLAINPGTDLGLAEPYLEQIDLLLCMTVWPGFGGQSFIPDVLDKVRAAASIRQASGLNFLIEVDGGISLENAAQCAQAGVNVLVAGTSLYGLEDMAAGVQAMRDSIQASGG